MIEQIRNENYEVIELPSFNFPINYDLARANKNYIQRKFEQSEKRIIRDKFGDRKKAGTLVVDHYLLSKEWEVEVQKFFYRVIVIDDLLDSPHVCSAIIDPNIRHESEIEKYKKSIFDTPIEIYSGAKYVIVREPFKKVKGMILKNLETRKDYFDVLIMFGGNDKKNKSKNAAEKILDILPRSNIHIVTGKNYLYLRELNELASNHDNVYVYPFNNNVHEIMGKCDIAIGALGTTTWERCFLGIPALVSVENDNQIKFVEYLQSLGIVYDIGQDMNKNKLSYGINKFIDDYDSFIQCRKYLMNIIDGDGINRIMKVITGCA